MSAPGVHGPGERTAAVDPVEQARILHQRARALAAPATLAEQAGETHLEARVADRPVLVPMDRARRVVDVPAVSAVPHCGEAILGIAAIDGALVPVADLATLLDIGTAERPVGRRALLVLHDQADVVAVVLDRVDGVTTVDRSDLPAPALDGAPPRIIAGFTDGGAAVIDVDSLLADRRLWPPRPAPPTDGGSAP